MTPKWKTERRRLLRDAEKFQEDRFEKERLRSAAVKSEELVYDIENSRTPRVKGETEMITQKMATTITPEMAATLLDQNTNNRPLRMVHVRKLAEIMSAGQWMLNGDTIVISNNGVLVDGQHRLAAVVRSKTTIKAFIIYGLPFEVFSTKDRSKNRSGGDALAIEGYKNTNLFAAMISIVHRVRTGSMTPGHRSKTMFEPQNIVALVPLYPDIEKSLRLRKTPGFPASVLSACHYLFSCISPEDADNFIDMIEIGANLPKHHPALTLRDRILTMNHRGVGELRQEFLVAITIKSWNSWRNKEDRKNIRFKSNEAFPEIR